MLAHLSTSICLQYLGVSFGEDAGEETGEETGHVLELPGLRIKVEFRPSGSPAECNCKKE